MTLRWGNPYLAMAKLRFPRLVSPKNGLFSSPKTKFEHALRVQFKDIENFGK